MVYKVGDRVRPTRTYCKWELDHAVENYQVYNGLSDEQLLNAMEGYAFWLAAYCGVRVYGRVKGFGNAGCLEIHFKSKFGEEHGYFEPKSVSKI